LIPHTSKMNPHDDPLESPSDELLDSLRLSLIPGVGPRTRQALLERFGTSSAVLAAAPSSLREVPGVGPKLLDKITTAEREIDPHREIEICRENHIQILMHPGPDGCDSYDCDQSDPDSKAADNGYPRLLGRIDDPPSVLFLRGRILPRDGLAIAIVGTRHATQYGLKQAEQLAGSLARAGFTIVSGLARGIDAAAHRGALAAGGRTLAVLGSGVMNIYPPEHERLAEEVRENGCVISESPPLFKPLSGSFPQRNRIISGLTLGTIIVEAPERSGALITARLAMEQNREVFAVPGRVDSRASRGCHKLLRDGAKLVATVDDVIEELGPLGQSVPRDDGPAVRNPAEMSLNPEIALNEIEQQVLAAIDTETTAIDKVIAETGLAAHRVLSTISVLEMRRLVRRVSGSSVVRP
ncbi:MAG: DNA-processing protein DprA, partial [Planctomycetota bacterium]|nr:DNA-processing protein DprA [Planctomycetota bacterium]